MKMLTTRGLFARPPTDDSHAHIDKIHHVWKVCIYGPVVMDVIGLHVFSLSLTGDTVVWFKYLPYNSIYTCEQLIKMFWARFFPLSKNLNKKDKLICSWYTFVFKLIMYIVSVFPFPLAYVDAQLNSSFRYCAFLYIPCYCRILDIYSWYDHNRRTNDMWSHGLFHIIHIVAHVLLISSIYLWYDFL